MTSFCISMGAQQWPGAEPYHFPWELSDKIRQELPPHSLLGVNFPDLRTCGCPGMQAHLGALPHCPATSGDEKIQAGGNAAGAVCSSPKLTTACKPCRAGNAGRRNRGRRCGSPTRRRHGGHLTPRLHLGKGTVCPDTHRRLGRPLEKYPSPKGSVCAEGRSRTWGGAVTASRRLEPVSAARCGPCSGEGVFPAG